MTEWLWHTRIGRARFGVPDGPHVEPMPRSRIGLYPIIVLLAAVIGVGCGFSPRPASPYPQTPASPFVVSRSEFDEAFPQRNPFYTYDDFIKAAASYPDFANTGEESIRRREAAAFLANVHHETAGLTLVEENVARRQVYCDSGRPYGCPAGKDAYFGRGPAQLSWNYNYRAAGDSLGLDLLADPSLVERDPMLAWRTALWFWNTQVAGAAATPHDAIVRDLGFGETIRAFNGALECDGANAADVQSRVDAYLRISALLGVSPGKNLYC
jgi:Chitinase class I